MKWLTATVLQYVAGALLLVCFALFARGCTLSAARDVAVAEQGKAESARDAARTERDAWKGVAETAQGTNAEWQRVWGVVETNRQREREEAARQAQLAGQQVAAAKRDEAKAERELGEFRRLFGKRPADCQAALQALDRVCPMLEGY